MVDDVTPHDYSDISRVITNVQYANMCCVLNVDDTKSSEVGIESCSIWLVSAGGRTGTSKCGWPSLFDRTSLIYF